MTASVTIGKPPWTRAELLSSLDEFVDLYERRPIRVNDGGMQAPHMFAVWFIARALAPDLIVESGVWRGQGTWLIEQACPTAELVCIDPALDRRVYVSSRAQYSATDFKDHDWSRVTDRSLAFFDDHQNEYARLQQATRAGFRHAVFEDNYPPGRGDCYSLQKAFAGTGFVPLAPPASTSLKHNLHRFVGRVIGRQQLSLVVPPTESHAASLRETLEVYAEFPPVIRPSMTRWGEPWDPDVYPTPEPLLEIPVNTRYRVFADEAEHYTWICYTRLR